jgi:HAE1 family hydrophobic/amphiphilic exporter-1
MLRPKMAEIPGINVYLQNPPVIRIGGMLTKSLYQFTLQGPDTQSLYQAAPRLEAKLKELPQLRDVTSDLQIKNPQDVVIDRDRAATLGLDARHVEDSLFSAYASRQVSTIFAPNNEYKVILELDPRYRDDPSALSMLYLRSPAGDLVPFDVVTRLESSKGPLTVNHLGQLPAVTLSFNLREGVSLSQAVSLVTQVARETLPPDISTSFQGTAQAFEASLRGMGTLLVMSIIVISVRAHESFVHPLTILSGPPSAGLGALLTLMLFHVDLNLYSFVGIIMLVGIVKKNAIMMIDFAIEAERKGGLTPSEAIYRGCLVRFRPIMMTTMAALMGTLPIAIGAGAGAESRRPLGLAVVGGLLVSQLITLYITPVYYTYLDSLQGWVMKRLPARWSAD